MGVSKGFFIGIILVWLGSVSIGVPLNQDDLANLETRRTVEHVLYEVYTETDRGAASVFGYHFDYFFAPSVYFTTTIFGAVNGNRGGYGIAAFGLGVQKALHKRFVWDSKCVVGSGGGGGLPAGGGFAIEALTGISVRCYRAVSLNFKGGFLTFPTGDFTTPVFHVGFSVDKYPLFLPWQ